MLCCWHHHPTSSCTMFLSFLTWAWLLRANDVALHATTSTARHSTQASTSVATPPCAHLTRTSLSAQAPVFGSAQPPTAAHPPVCLLLQRLCCCPAAAGCLCCCTLSLLQLGSQAAHLALHPPSTGTNLSCWLQRCAAFQTGPNNTPNPCR